MRLCLSVMLLLAAVPYTLAGAEAPTTAPSTQINAMKRLWIELDAPDPGIREKSRLKLYSLSRDELPALKTALEFFRPLTASQLALAKDVASHVYLSGAAYDHTDDGFLGIRMPQTLPESGDEVVIETRLPGFCAYGLLQNGDAILDIEERPLHQPAQRMEFMTAIKSLRPGTPIHLKVRRGGQEMRVEVRLDGYPVDRA